MTDIPQDMVERVAGELRQTYLTATNHILDKQMLRKMAEAAIREAFRPLPMKDAPRDGTEIDIFTKTTLAPGLRRTVGVRWEDDCWISYSKGVLFHHDDRLLVGWLPIPEVSHD